MSLIAIPILAQVLTVGAGDRTELRSVFDATGNDLQLESRAAIGAALTGRHAAIGLGYSPGIIIAPLEEREDLAITLLQNVFAGAGVAYSYRRTSWSLAVRGNVAQRNFLLEAFSAGQPNVPGSDGADPGDPSEPDGGDAPDPADPTEPAPSDPGASPGAPPGSLPLETPTRVTPDSIWYGSARAEAGVLHIMSRTASFRSLLAYEVRGGLDQDTRADFPVVYGPDAQLALLLRLSRRDELTSSVGALYAEGSEGGRAWTVWERERWLHRFSSQTEGVLGAGFAVTREEPIDEPHSTSVYPTGEAILTNESMLSRGVLTTAISARYAPSLDPVSVRLDPRFQAGAQANWVRDPVYMALNVNGAISLDPEATGGLATVGAGATFGYLLGAGFSAETGGRAAWQTFQGNETIPLSGVVFIAIQWSGVTTL
jgi:hypothetical protein